MNYAQALSDKFSAPKLHGNYTYRYTLLNTLTKGMEKDIIYIAAPSGFGKTTTVIQWLEYSKYPYVWIDLDEYDNTLTAFYRLLCMGIYAFQSDNEAMAKILASPTFNTLPVEHSIELITSFIPNGTSYVIVLDRAQLVSNKEILKSFLMVKKRLPKCFTIIVITNNEANHTYIDKFEKESLVLLIEKDFAFSESEIHQHFISYGNKITLDDAKEIKQITQGWAIGINALAMSGLTKLNSTDGGLVFSNYIKTQLWDKLDIEVQEFLLQTSIVDDITVEMANLLSNREDSQEVLDILCMSNFFVNKTGKESYSYHSLFLAFLADMRKKDSHIKNEDLYKLVALHYLKRNRIFLARKYAIKSKDKETIDKTNYAIDQEESTESHILSVENFVNVYRSMLDDDSLHDVLDDHPYLYSQYAGYSLIVGDSSTCEWCLDMIDKHLPRIAKEHEQFESDVLFMTLIDYRKSVYSILKQMVKHIAKISFKKNLQWNTITMQLPYFYRSARDYSELANGKTLQVIFTFITPLFGSFVRNILYALQADFLFERNKTDESLALIQKTLSSNKGEQSGEQGFCLLMTKANNYAAIDDQDNLNQSIKDLQSFIIQDNNPQFFLNFEAFKTRIKLQDANQEIARSWLDKYYIVDDELYLYKIYQYFTTVRAHIVLGQSEQALQFIKKLESLATQFNRPLDIAETKVLRASVEYALRQRKKALETIEEVILFAQQYEFIRVIADEGAAILPVLKRLSVVIENSKNHKELDVNFLHKVILATHEKASKHCGVTHYIRPPKLKLSKQQKHMLQLLSEGYRNAEIANITGLTIYTVKYHLSAAYKKLCVDNAMDAVLKAKEEHLLDS